MTVYIILEDFDYEGFDAPVAVFDNEDKARDYVITNSNDLHRPVIFKMEVK